MKRFKKFNEDAPANATGVSVVGTGDNVVSWVKPSRRKKNHIDGVAFLRRRGLPVPSKMNKKIKAR